MKDKHVTMVQMARFRWNLLSSSGIVISEDVLMRNRREAEEWANAYISSFVGWSVVIMPLKTNKEEV